MISRSCVSRIAVIGSGLLLAVSTAGVAAAAGVQDPVAVAPNMYFTGVVGNQTSPGVIVTDCVGPIVQGETGHPVGGQSVEAITASSSAADTGYTGSAAHSILVTLGVPSSTSSDVIGTTSNFFVPLAIPTTLTVPCAGSGVVTFAPQPTSPTAVSATVDVTFVSEGAAG